MSGIFMYLVNSTEMRAIDNRAISDYGLPGIVLMENAAQGVFRAIMDYWPKWCGSTRGHSPCAFVLAGPGQNGGDGWALARILAAHGFKVRTFFVANKGQEVRGDAAVNLAIVKRLPLPVEDAGEAVIPWGEADLVVDAIFGTGLARPLSGPAAEVLTSLTSAKKELGPKLRLVAVDVPSGLSADTGELFGPAGPVDLTVTLGLPKVGLYLQKGPEISGEIVLGDIGATPEMIGSPPGRLATKALAATHLPPRPKAGHKGTFGHTLLVGGAAGKTGALVLAALGALRSGTGLVTALHPLSLAPIYETKLTEAMTGGLPEESPGELDGNAGETILKHCADRQALALGPGLGLNDGARETVLAVGRKCPIPLVIDADALTHLQGQLTELKASAVVLTPHPGEAARLLASTIVDVQNDRLGAARKLAALSGAVVVLKGQHTITAQASGEYILNTTGGPYLGVGGSGDLLTGLIAGLLAQGLPPFTAAWLGVWLHGRAADLAAQTLGSRGILPGDMVKLWPQVWQELSSHPNNLS